MDGDDLSVYDDADGYLEQNSNDVDTLAQLDRELTEHSLGELFFSYRNQLTQVMQLNNFITSHV